MSLTNRRLAAAVGLAVAVVAACTASTLQRKRVGDPCQSSRADCSFGLECRVPSATDPRATTLDGGSLPADAGLVVQADAQSMQSDGGPQRRCEYLFYAECSDEAGGPQCLSGQKCREGHCTVQCATDLECGEGGLCKIGVCQRKKTQLTQCYDNRDCAWPDTCFHGQCVTRTDAYRCNTDLDCGLGYRCLNGRCQ